MIGFLPAKQALTRAQAQVGDAVLVSGPLGDAAAALCVMEGHWSGGQEHREYLLERFYRPTAQLALGEVLLDVASAAIDISDGLLADAGHIAAASGAAIVIDAAAVPLSGALQSHSQLQQAREWALAGGDDYELCFTVPVGKLARVPGGCTVVGQVEPGIGIRCRGFEHLSPGYQHF